MDDSDDKNHENKSGSKNLIYAINHHPNIFYCLYVKYLPLNFLRISIFHVLKQSCSNLF